MTDPSAVSVGAGAPGPRPNVPGGAAQALGVDVRYGGRRVHRPATAEAPYRCVHGGSDIPVPPSAWLQCTRSEVQRMSAALDCSTNHRVNTMRLGTGSACAA